MPGLTEDMAVKRPFDFHTMTQLERQRALDGAQMVLDGMQNETPEQIVLGAAILFAGLVDRLGLDPEGMYLMGRRVLNPEDFHRRANDSAQSLKDFISIRVKGERNVTFS